jgi:hypothetical protein
MRKDGQSLEWGWCKRLLTWSNTSFFPLFTKTFPTLQACKVPKCPEVGVCKRLALRAFNSCSISSIDGMSGCSGASYGSYNFTQDDISRGGCDNMPSLMIELASSLVSTPNSSWSNFALERDIVKG